MKNFLNLFSQLVNVSWGSRAGIGYIFKKINCQIVNISSFVSRKVSVAMIQLQVVG